MSAMKKVIIKVTSNEQQENIKNTRKSLKDLQQPTADKENFVGRTRIDKSFKLAPETDKQGTKRKKVANKSVQTNEATQATITAEDLTSDEPSDDYWKLLAEKRGEALNDSLQENERLKENIDALKEENKLSKEMLDESRNLVEVLQEMLGDETETETANETNEENQN